MIRKIFYLILICHANLNAQNRNSQWVFGDSAGIDFTNLASPQFFASGMDSRGSSASISDSNGTLLFYAFTRDGNGNFSAQIFSNNNQIMQNGDTIIGESWYNELVIIPKPGSNHLFYLFHRGIVFPPSAGFYYSLIDMNLNGGLGAVTQKNIQLNNFENADCGTAIKHGNGRDWWLLSKPFDASSFQNWFYLYLVTPDSIYAPLIQQFNNATDGGFQEIVFNSDGSQFMQLNANGFLCEYDFDRCTGAITIANLIYTEQTGTFDRFFIFGAYSPDDSKFYLTTRLFGSINQTYLLQYDLTAPNIPLSCDTLYTNYPPVESGTVRLAPDNKIYFTSFYYWGFPGYPYPDSVRNVYNENLGVINFPDSAGSACDFQPFSFNLGGKRTYYGLPNNPNYSLGALTGSICDSLTGIPNIEQGIMKAEFFVTYVSEWEKLFVNAQNIKGKSCTLTIFDLNGREIFSSSRTTQPPYFTQDISCTAFAKGMYIVSLQTEKEKLVKKFIKE